MVLPDLDPFRHGKPVEQHRVATLVEIAEHTARLTDRLTVPGRRKKRIQVARRGPEAVAGELRRPRHQSRNKDPCGDRPFGIQDRHREIVVADDPSRHRNPLQCRMSHQRMAHGIQRCAQGRIVCFFAEAPAVARPFIEYAQVVERKRRLVPTVDDSVRARIFAPIILQVGLLRFRQRGKSRPPAGRSSRRRRIPSTSRARSPGRTGLLAAWKPCAGYGPRPDPCGFRTRRTSPPARSGSDSRSCAGRSPAARPECGGRRAQDSPSRRRPDRRSRWR